PAGPQPRSDPVQGREVRAHEVGRPRGRVTGRSRALEADAVFCGRDAELAALERAWDTVAHADAPEPRVVALVAESGLGKTRIVQEFYRRLSVREQGETLRYWPPSL